MAGSIDANKFIYISDISHSPTANDFHLIIDNDATLTEDPKSDKFPNTSLTGMNTATLEGGSVSENEALNVKFKFKGSVRARPKGFLRIIKIALVG